MTRAATLNGALLSRKRPPPLEEVRPPVGGLYPAPVHVLKIESGTAIISAVWSWCAGTLPTFDIEQSHIALLSPSEATLYLKYRLMPLFECLIF